MFTELSRVVVNKNLFGEKVVSLRSEGDRIVAAMYVLFA